MRIKYSSEFDETTFVCDFNCVDYRNRSDVTRKEAQPVFGIDEIPDMLAGAKWFSTLDFASSYWQVKVCPEDHPKGALTTLFGLYHVYVMPFGLRNAPAAF
ncbi:RNA-directed DNA polymerase -like protein [Trichinella papuae]|uniref:RNA-directed DNA polymerase-like protein n=1 Tax=Trichinella papuae TaxID=268474 RepID=A0A0V1MM74_9BILA|nr:RNA-directed DNA polymerase -like protein [Trichinella papuae]